MSFKHRFIIFCQLIVALVVIQNTWGQSTDFSNKTEYFIVKGHVWEKYTKKPIVDASIQVNGISQLKTSFDGAFKIKVKLGDQLMVSHTDFQTVFYTIDSNDQLIIEVEEDNTKLSQAERRKQNSKIFTQLIDSASIYLANDAERSLQFIVDALDKSQSQQQNAKAYQTLGDLYMFWKQYDLAVTNYRIALQNENSTRLKLKLAKAHRFNKKPNSAVQVYNTISKSSLSELQLTQYYEGLGDTYITLNNVESAISCYKKGLQVANDFVIRPKIADFNSKIAQAYNLEGNQKEAKRYFDSSMKSAKRVSPKRAIEEQVTVAEFNNNNKAYSNEIEIRKDVVAAVKQIEKDSIISNESPITPQKQNYKIGNALILQKNYNAAIPFLDQSISEADKREDLEVKNDALRRKAEALENLGEYDAAKKTFQEFMASVDQLYIKKQQEISRSTRLAKSIVESQNRVLSLEKDRELSKSRYELTEQKNKTQQIVIYALVGGLLLFLVATYFTFNYIKQQRISNNLLALKSLRSQMNPHFIFNALNSVNSFIATSDERTANKYLSDFSFLMRAVLENSEEDFIPLSKEIELLKLYTKLEHFRFKDKFDYTIEIDESITIEDFKIPPMLLQPYIENAVWHGLRYKTSKGILKISIEAISQKEISVSIVDDGIGRKRSKAMKTANQKKHKSKGLTNIKKRIQILNTMYKGKIDVSIEDYIQAEDTGTKVKVILKRS